MCFRYFEFTDFRDIDRLTIPQINLMQEAVHLKSVDRSNDIHMIAYLTNVAGATKKQGNSLIPVYKKYADFYDYEKELNRVKRPNKAKTQAMYDKLSKLVNKQKGGETNERNIFS